MSRHVKAAIWLAGFILVFTVILCAVIAFAALSPNVFLWVIGIFIVTLTLGAVYELILEHID